MEQYASSFFSASLRNDSLNTGLATLTKVLIENNGGQVDFADMSEFDCLSYNHDAEVKGNPPAGAEEF